MNATILDVPRMQLARRERLTEMIKEARVFSRRAEIPEDRAALAEIERSLLNLEADWERKGLLAPQDVDSAGADLNLARV